MFHSFFNNFSFRFYYITICIVSIFFTACSSDSFRIEGEINGADNMSLILERSDFEGNWIIMDSVHTDSNGHFRINFERPAAPDIFRLRAGDRFVYIPIDSTEHLNLFTSAISFGMPFNLVGSIEAEKMSTFENEVNLLQNITDTDSIERFKKKIFKTIIQDGKADLMSYHVLTKTIGNKLLFDPKNPTDIKYFAAVATAYRQYKPHDPRTQLLENTAIYGQRQRNSNLGRHNFIEVEETVLIDIELEDIAGKKCKLSDVVSNNKPTIVIFSVLTHTDSPSVNRKISSIYNKYGNQINIYQVCLDNDLHLWREAAINLPWTVVYDPNGEYSVAASQYNVSALPAIFIYNRKGELEAQASSFIDLDKRLSAM